MTETSRTTQTATLPTAEAAEYIADTVARTGSGRPAVDGTTVELSPRALSFLAELAEDSDGHYDGQYLWIGGSEYLVVHPVADEDDEIRAEVRDQIQQAENYLTASLLRAAADQIDANPDLTISAALCAALERPEVEALFAAAHAAWPAVGPDDPFGRAFGAINRVAHSDNKARRLATVAALVARGAL